MMKHTITLTLLFVAGSSLQALAATQDYCDFNEGRLGKLTVGSNLAQVESALSHKLALDFAGDHKSSTTVDKPRDLSALGIKSVAGGTVTAADLFFYDSPSGGDVLKQVYLGMPCSTVVAIHAACEKRGDLPGFFGPIET